MNLFSFIFGLFLVLAAQSSSAQVAITDVTVKRPIPGQAIGAGYFSLSNPDDVARVLVAVSSGAAESIEMHTHVHEHHGDHQQMTMKMVKVDEVEIPAKSMFIFEPGKHHLMVFSPDEEALSSGVVDLVFTFENGETIGANAKVENW